MFLRLGEFQANRMVRNKELKLEFLLLQFELCASVSHLMNMYSALTLLQKHDPESYKYMLRKSRQAGISSSGVGVSTLSKQIFSAAWPRAVPARVSQQIYEKHRGQWERQKSGVKLRLMAFSVHKRA